MDIKDQEKDQETVHKTPADEPQSKLPIEPEPAIVKKNRQERQSFLARLRSRYTASSAGTSWSRLIVGALPVAYVGGLLLARLSKFIGASPTELATIEQGRSLASLSDSLLLAPYKLLVYCLMKLPGSDLLHVRLASVIIICLSIWLFFTLARRWYGTVNSVWTSIAFASSTWVLQTGRFGAGYCLLILTILALLNMAAWLNTTTRHSRALVVFALTSGLALYTPGGLWFALAASAAAYRSLLLHRSKTKPSQLALAAGLFAGLAVGLSSSLVQSTASVVQWIGLPHQLPATSVIAKQAAGSISYVVARGPVLPENWLAHTPLLDVASTVLLLLGALFYARHLRNSRTRLLVSFGILSIALIGLNGGSALNYAIPLIYLIIGGGFAFVMYQWKRVFPYNPIARSTSLVLMSVLLIAVISFHTVRYFVAWRSSPDTIQAYDRQSLMIDPYKSYAHLIQ